MHLRENKISNLDGFSEELKNLSEINLRANEIESFEEIDKLSCLPNLKRVVLQGILSICLKNIVTFFFY